MVATGIWNGAQKWARPVLAIAKLMMLSPAQGAEAIVYLAASSEVEGRTGLFFEKNRPRELPALALDDVAAKRLWEHSAKLVNLLPT
jgi:hypothetical protein